MPVAAIISGVIALIEAIPIFDRWFQALSTAYNVKNYARMQKENQDAIRSIVLDQDQRDAERAIGAPDPGEPSGLPGTSIVDQLPGVKK